MIEKIEATIKEACTVNGVGLYDIEIKNAAKGPVICVYITKIGGVSVDDCANVNRSISQQFEENEPFPDKYFLEVSSPGLERTLKFKKHYMSAINETIKVTYYSDGKSVSAEGTLLEVNQDNLVIAIGEESLSIPFNTIKKARTVYHFGKKEKS
ncbi:MAG TPA: ribosome maturation factor RimP [Candidatus Cloacimonadota bacterium]|nr:ribosome maturation factor RimP [Candidatus Cloacimonadota bacterium]HPM02616.1 ribosome maturation factor RimP [Candidatus Cloacimonadota bacterium]